VEGKRYLTSLQRLDRCPILAAVKSQCVIYAIEFQKVALCAQFLIVASCNFSFDVNGPLRFVVFVQNDAVEPTQVGKTAGPHGKTSIA
jgi:hypothetical protein